MDIANGSAGRYITQLPPEASFCAGCNTCEIVCSLVHDGVVSPGCNRIFVEKNIRTMYHTIHSCRHCSGHPCYNACPKKDKAMIIGNDGIVYIDEENCIGCGLCIKACSQEPPRINIFTGGDKAQRKAKKCDLCRTREEGPACVQWCPVRCISVADAIRE